MGERIPVGNEPPGSKHPAYAHWMPVYPVGFDLGGVIRLRKSASLTACMKAVNARDDLIAVEVSLHREGDSLVCGAPSEIVAPVATDRSADAPEAGVRKSRKRNPVDRVTGVKLVSAEASEPLPEAIMESGLAEGSFAGTLVILGSDEILHAEGGGGRDRLVPHHLRGRGLPFD